MNLSSIQLAQFLQGLLLIALAPGLYGWLDYFKARGQGRDRRFMYVLQPYRDLVKLFRQPAVRSQTTSWVFAIAPVVVFAAYSTLAFVVPVFCRPPLLAVDLIVVVYVLGLARFTLSLAGLDAGSAFGGLGSSREMFLQFLTEVGLVFVLAALTLQWNTLSLDRLFTPDVTAGIRFERVGLMFLAPALAILVLFEAGRIPVDNPDTRLELTMGQKAITLEYAGRDLALIEWAEMIKLAFLFTLFANLFISFLDLISPIGQGEMWRSALLMTPIWLVQLALFALLLAWWELRQPKLRLRQVTGLAWFSIAFSLASILFTIIERGAA